MDNDDEIPVVLVAVSVCGDGISVVLVEVSVCGDEISVIGCMGMPGVCISSIAMCVSSAGALGGIIASCFGCGAGTIVWM